MPKAVSDNIIFFDPRRGSNRTSSAPDTVLRIIGEGRRTDGKWVTRCVIIQPSAEIVPLEKI
ncbi:hypothetical protein [Bradyrhizobium sp. CB3481]|uniref:hypothetical protein n=1 Tax=Bradyrhizobium sp. CB3481 TaxID=3039158 RepID=UPI0024B19475|nr:hypothetical protein [Bradyrhizobium sp. CB3481]WFU14420.1 hypothetical protein QA643_24905 [Bradyrhizobium sp. CB3481]